MRSMLGSRLRFTSYELRRFCALTAHEDSTCKGCRRAVGANSTRCPAVVGHHSLILGQSADGVAATEDIYWTHCFQSL